MVHISPTRFNLIETQLAVDFPIQDFIDSLWYHLGKPLEGDFWNNVILSASKEKTELSTFQRKHLYAWIQNNYYWITQNFSHRAKITLQHRMKLL